MQQVVLMLTYDLAAHGTEWAVEFIAERTEGRVTQGVDVSTTNNGPLVAILNAPAGDQHVAVSTSNIPIGQKGEGANIPILSQTTP